MTMPRSPSTAAPAKGLQTEMATNMATAMTPASGVLVVEDDELIREVTADTLQDAGFRVSQAANAHDAMAILASGEKIGVLVTDVHMPGDINGYGLARRVRERWPFIEIVLVSGYAAPHRQDLNLDCSFLVKPFDAAALIQQVRTLIRRGR